MAALAMAGEASMYPVPWQGLPDKAQRAVSRPHQLPSLAV